MGIFTNLNLNSVLGTVAGVYSATQAKKAAQLSADAAAKQQAHDLKMREAGAASPLSFSSSKIWLLAITGIAAIGLIMFGKKR